MNGAFSLISFIDKLAIVKIRIIEEFVLEPVSKLVAIDIHQGVAGALTGRESKLIASRKIWQKICPHSRGGRFRL